MEAPKGEAELLSLLVDPIIAVAGLERARLQGWREVCRFLDAAACWRAPIE